MPLESATYINGLVASNPTASDQKAQGDDHIRLLKSTIQASFPQVTGAVTASHTELNLMDGMTVQPAAKDGSNLTTPDLGDNSTKIATTAFVAASAFSASLPGQTGQGGNFLTTNGTTASWKQVYPSVTGNNGKFLMTDGITTSWGSPLPSQIGKAGQILVTDGSNTSWQQPTGLVLLSTQTVTTAQTNLDFLNVFSSSYDKYVIEIQGVNPSTDSNSLYLLCAVAGVVDTSPSYFLSSTSDDSAGTSSILKLTTYFVGSSTGLGATMTVEMRNTNDTTAGFKGIGIRGISWYTAAQAKVIISEGGYSKPSALSGFRLYWSGGAQFTKGTVRVYGQKNT